MSHDDRPTSPAGTIIPLYTRPDDDSWTALVRARHAWPNVSVVAVINPASGPGRRREQAYVDGIARLQEAGVRVIGYVSTGLVRKRSPAGVVADLRRYRRWYPRLDGIFLDEVTREDNRGTASYYANLGQEARRLEFPYIVGNAGAEVDDSYLAAVDTMLVYERPGLPRALETDAWLPALRGRYERGRLGIIPYDVEFDARFVHAASRRVGFIYMTDARGSNPWKGLPSYFDELMAALDRTRPLQ